MAEGKLMTVKSDEFAEEIIDMHSDICEYGINALSLVYFNCPSGSEYRQYVNVRESKDGREAYKTSVGHEKKFRKLEESILEQGAVLRKQGRKIESIKEEMKKQEGQLRDIMVREKDTKDRLESLNIAALFRNELYMEQLRSGKI